MPDEITFRKWEFKFPDVAHLDPVQVRDLLIECFYIEQGDTFRKAKDNLKVAYTEQDILQRAISVVATGFRKTGGDFKNPTKEQLLKVLDYLASTSASWGTPDEILEYNIAQISKAIALLK